MTTIRVLSTFAFKEAYVELVPQFERASGHQVETTWEPTVGVMRRMAAGEVFDLVIMSSDGIDKLIASGQLAAGSRIDVAKVGIGAAVRVGARRPDIGSGEALKRALLAAQSIGYSTGPSGVYLESLFVRMDIADEIKPRITVSKPGIPVGDLVASGEIELGFQQVSELLPVKGIDFLGPLSADVQKITVFSAGRHVGAKAIEAGAGLIKFFKAPEAAPVIREKGLEPA